MLITQPDLRSFDPQVGVCLAMINEYLSSKVVAGLLSWWVLMMDFSTPRLQSLSGVAL